MSGFFRLHGQVLSFPKATPSQAGLRRAQLGAIFAIGSHATISTEPAIISLPTGTGKTGVIMIAPFLLGAERALVITPSRMVRDQIVEEFQSLTLLKHLGVIPSDLPVPTVLGIESKILRDEQWNTLVGADVVVTTPMGSSPALDDVPHPPNDLFDLLLVDEAHHSPARTWAALLHAFPQSRQILFTATPYRRDRRLLPGHHIYDFPIREAVRDGVFGAIRFIPCDPNPSQQNDHIIAIRAEQEFQTDRAVGLDHRLMVRTDSRVRATALKDVYDHSTSLRLNVIHGQHSLRHVRRTLQSLRDGALDGVICVDMFGEGVDVPQLKIAAIHAPHRSLAVTLQFIGRFARTSAAHIGEAKFIAVPEEIDAETKELYQQGAIWEELVTNLADARVSTERQLRDALRTFSGDAATSQEDITLSVIKPWYHCKVFHVASTVNLHTGIEFGGDITVLDHFISDELNCAVYICRSLQKPRWLEVPTLQHTEYLLFIIYFDEATRLLFINSSIKNEDTYSAIAEQIVTDSLFRGISTSQINRALRALSQPSFFSVGLKNRLFGNQVESYRIIAGGKADGALSNTDGQLFDRGHVFGSGDGEDGKATLGISTLSKVWSNRSGFVPEFVSWCRAIAEHLSNSAPVVTGSRLDLLSTGEEVALLPAPAIAATWHETAYKIHPTAVVQGDAHEVDLLSLDLEVVHSTDTSITIVLSGLSSPATIAFDITNSQHFRVECGAGEVIVRFRTQEGTLERYLNSYGLHFYLADLSRLYRTQVYRSNLSPPPFSNDAIVTHDWPASGVDITCEYGPSPSAMSIHDGLSAMLCATSAPVIVYDHRPGEVADLVVLDDADGRVKCDVYHCKKSSQQSPGSRVQDAYDVVGQIVKSVVWSKSAIALKTQLIRRLASGSTIHKGTLVELERILDRAESVGFEFHVRLVQPGLSASRLSEEVSRVLASGHDYVRLTTGYAPQIWTSA